MGGILKFFLAMVAMMLATWAIGRVLNNEWIVLSSAPAAFIIVGLWSMFAPPPKPPQ
jgi:hypothetical protein